MAASPAIPAERSTRADLILTATIALVCALVLGLVVVLGATARLESDTVYSRLTNRAARNQAFAFSQAYSDATGAQRNYLLGHDPARLAEFAAAKAEARDRLVRLRRVVVGDAAAT